MQKRGKYETNVSYTDLCRIVNVACDLHAEESLAAAHPNMYERNIAGKPAICLERKK